MKSGIAFILRTRGAHDERTDSTLHYQANKQRNRISNANNSAICIHIDEYMRKRIDISRREPINTNACSCKCTRNTHTNALIHQPIHACITNLGWKEYVGPALDRLVDSDRRLFRSSRSLCLPSCTWCCVYKRTMRLCTYMHGCVVIVTMKTAF